MLSRWMFISVILLSSVAGALAAENTTEALLPKLMDFGAQKCKQCKLMAPILEELKTDFKGQFDVEFVDVSVKENIKRAEPFKVEIIPLQVFLDKNGKELWRHEGFISREDILAKWKELKYEFKSPAK